MAQELPGLKVGVTLDSATFVAEMRKLQNSIDGFGRNVTRQTQVVSGAFTTLTTSVKAFGIGLATALGVGSISQLANLAKGALDAAGKLSELSQQAGVTVEQLQILTLAGVQAGVSQDELTQSLGRLGRRMADAGDTRPLVQGLGDVAERIQAASTATKKQAIAFEEFGRAGLKMIPILNQGREGLAGIANTAVKAGLVLGSDLVDEADRASDAIATMQFAFSQGFQVGLVTELSGEIQSTEEAIKRSAEAGRRFGEAFGNAIASIMERIGPFLNALEDIDQFFVKIDRFLKETVGTSLADPTGIVGAIGGALQVNAPDAQIQEIEHLKTVLAELNAEREKFEQLASSVGVPFAESEKLVELNERIKNVKDRLAELTGEQKKATGEQILFGDAVAGATGHLKEQEKAQKQAAKELERLNARREETIGDLETELLHTRALVKAYGESATAVRRVEAAIKADNKVRELRLDADSAEATLIAALINEIDREREAIERLQLAEERRFDSFRQMNDEELRRRQGQLEAGGLSAPELQEQTEQATDIWAETWKNAIESVQSTLTNQFQDFFEGNLTSAKDFANSLRSVFANLAANLATQAIFNPQMISQLFGGAAGAPGAQPTAAAGFGSSFTGVGGLLAAGALGTGAGLTAFTLAGGKNQTAGLIGSTGGALVGAGIGSLVPGIGTLVGGLAGGAAGGLLGSLFGGGGGGSSKSGRVGGSLGSTGGPSGFGFVKEMDAAIASLLNTRQRAVVDRFLGQAAGATFSFKGELGQGTIEHVAGQRGREIAAGLGFRPQGIAPGATAPQQVVANLKSALEARRAIEDLTGSVTAFDRQVEDLQDQFADLNAKGKQFGISTAGLTQAMREQRTELKKAQDAQLSALLDPFRALSAPLEAFKAELAFTGLSPAEQFQKAQAEFRRIAGEAQAGSLAALEQLQGAGRLFIELAGAAGASPGRDAALREVTETTTAALERIGTAQAEASRGIENVLERTRREQDLNLKNLIATTQDLIKEVKRSRV